MLGEVPRGTLLANRAVSSVVFSSNCRESGDAPVFLTGLWLSLSEPDWGRLVERPNTIVTVDLSMPRVCGCNDVTVSGVVIGDGGRIGAALVDVCGGDVDS